MLRVSRAALLAVMMATVPTVSGVVPAASETVSAKEAFDAAKELGTVEAWEAFLESYPEGFLGNLAKAYVKKLKGEGASDAAPADDSSPASDEKSEKDPAESEPAEKEAKEKDQTDSDSTSTEAAEEQKESPPGATVYVDTKGSDDNGDGSAEKPWATITNAVRNAEDGSTILVRPGLYMGRVSLRPGTPFKTGVTIRSEVPYQARIRSKDATTVTCYDGCEGLTIEGFDIAHVNPGTKSRLIVFHVDGQGDKKARRIRLRNNIFHDSFDNDILKINNNATDVIVEGNMFYNQSSSDEHLDVNSVTDVIVQDNIFFNDFKGSGREQPEETSSFMVIKDSNGDEDSQVGCDGITVRRNIFANWQGGPGSGFLLVGEDGKPFHEARNVTIENNLMLGNSAQVMRAPFGTKGVRDVTFRNNTIVGNMPGRAFAMRLNVEGENPPNENIRFYNNIWSDPTGTMGDTGEGTMVRFAEVPEGESKGVVLNNNLYWNGGGDIPSSGEDAVNVANDPRKETGDPGLGDQKGLVIPRWNEKSKKFADGSATIREAFEKLVTSYGTPASGGAAVDSARADQAPKDDILGAKRPKGGKPDLGAVELE